MSSTRKRGNALGVNSAMHNEGGFSMSPKLLSVEVPNKLELELTRSCAQMCEHCSVFGAPMGTENDVSQEVLIRAIDQFAYLGGKRVVITGGEPFERGTEFVLELVRHASSRSLSTIIYTSGYPINETLAKNLAESGLSIACVSLEGSGAVHEKITRVEGSYDYARRAIRLLYDSGITVVVHFTVMSPNVEDLTHVAEAAEAEGASSLKIINFIPQGRGRANQDKLGIDDAHALLFFEEMELLKQKKSLKIEFGGQFERGKSECSIGKRITITCNGDVIPCLGVRWDKQYVFGNIKNSTLESIWCSEKFLALQHSSECICSVIWSKG